MCFFLFCFFFLLTVPNRLDIFLYKPTIRCNIQVKSCFHLNIYKEELRHVLSRVLTWTFSSEFTESIFFSPNLENSERNYKFVALFILASFFLLRVWKSCTCFFLAMHVCRQFPKKFCALLSRVLTRTFFCPKWKTCNVFGEKICWCGL